MPIAAFLSHSHRDRILAAELKYELAKYGFDTFLAHQDILPSDEWEKEILRNLKKCQVFFPLLTGKFIESDWTDQETGLAVCRRKIIVPLSKGITPYGFINKYQAQKVRDSIPDTCWKVINKLAKHRKIGKEVRLGVIDHFVNSGSFESANSSAPRLARLAPFSQQELTRILKGSISNSQIYCGFKARDVVRTLIEEQPGLADKKLAKRFEERVKANS
jgi:hypothetical protein